MATEDKRIQRIIDNVSNVNNGQIAIEPGDDGDIGGKRFGYKDADGGEHKCLNKDEAARVTTLNATTSLQRNGNEVFVNGDQYIDLDTSSSAPAETPGRMFWDIDNDCPAYYDSVSGTVVQITKEMLVDAVNNTGAQIDNGTVVCVTGNDATANLPEISKANSGDYNLNEVLAVATHNVADSTTGKFTKFGLVNDFDTSALDEGNKVYLSTTSGLLTSTRPQYPAKPIIVGYCIKSHATEGRLLVDIHTDRYDYEFDGCAIEKQEYYIVEQSGTVYCDVEKLGGGDLPCQLSGDIHLLDCTTGSGVSGRARVALTAGTDTSPQYNYVYVSLVGGVPTLQSSVTAPTGSYASIGYISLWSAAKTVTDGPLLNRRTTDAIAHDGRGHMAHLNERIRAMGAAWVRGSGLTPTVTINTTPTPDSVDASFTAGKFWQLHKQDAPALQVSVDGAYVLNASGSGSITKYQKITDLNEIDELADGTSLVQNNRINFSIVLIGNKTTTECKLGVLMPTGTYATNDSAYKDINNYTPLIADDEVWEVCVPLVRIPLLYTATGNFSFINPVGESEWIDLRGTLMNANSGGSGGSGGANVLNDLDDVAVSTPSNAQLLAYIESTGLWENKSSIPLKTGESIEWSNDSVTGSTDAISIKNSDLSNIKTVAITAMNDDPHILKVTDKYIIVLEGTAGDYLRRYDRNTGELLEAYTGGTFWGGQDIYANDDTVFLLYPSNYIREIDIDNFEAGTNVPATNAGLYGYGGAVANNGDLYVLSGSIGLYVFVKNSTTNQYDDNSYNLDGIQDSADVYDLRFDRDNTYFYVVDVLGTSNYVRKYDTATRTLQASSPLLTGTYNRRVGLFGDYLVVFINDIPRYLKLSDLTLAHTGTATYTNDVGDFYDGVFYSATASTLNAHQLPALTLKPGAHLDLTRVKSSAYNSNGGTYSLDDFCRAVEYMKSISGYGSVREIDMSTVIGADRLVRAMDRNSIVRLTGACQAVSVYFDASILAMGGFRTTVVIDSGVGNAQWNDRLSVYAWNGSSYSVVYVLVAVDDEEASSIAYDFIIVDGEVICPGVTDSDQGVA